MRESGREIEMNDTVVDETDGTIVTNFVYEENNTEKKSWKFCNNVTLPRSEVVFMSQMVLILILLAFFIFKLSLTQLTCEETSVWFSTLSGLVGYVLPNPRLWINLLIHLRDFFWPSWAPRVLEKRS